MSDEELRTFFKFDEADLGANRQGELTEKQTKRLLAEERYIKNWSLAGGLVMVLITGVGLFSSVKASVASGWEAGILFEILTLVGGLISWVLLQRVFFKPALIVAIAQGQAKIIEANRYNVQSHKNTPYYELQIDDQRFMVSSLLVDIMDGKEFIIYYIDHTAEHPLDTYYLNPSRDILSLESLIKNSEASVLESTSIHEGMDATSLDYSGRENL